MYKHALLAALSLIATPAFAEPGPETGLYEVTLTPDGEKAQVNKRCVTAEDLTRELRLARPSTDGCKVLRHVFASGKIDYANTCPMVSLTMSGTYTATTYQYDDTRTIGDQVRLVHTSGKKVADSCPAS